MKILFLLPYPLKQAPSQRFRVEQYLEILTAHGHTWEIESFLRAAEGASLFDSRSSIAKLIAVLHGFYRRVGMLFRLSDIDSVFIHREAAPVGPPIIEWIIAKVIGKKIIYDFDDAIWTTDNNKESLIKKMLKWRNKVGSICRWSHVVSCGNDWLAAYAQKFNSNVVVNPTTIDTVSLHRRDLYPQVNEQHTITIGWTGSYTTLKYLAPLEVVIAHLEKKYPGLIFLVIADVSPQMNLTSIRFKPWSMQSEVQDLLVADIGVMPLPDDEWSKGKCGFKALQYMALEIPTILSPVGVNTKIVTEGENGFFASSEKEWIQKLDRLIEDKTLRERTGKAGRKKVEDYFSVSSNASLFLSLFE